MEMKFKKNRVLIGAGIGIFLLLVFWMLFSPSPVKVETSEAVRGQMLVTIDGEGKTRIRDKFVVTAPISGKMARVKIREGDFIPKEFVITEIDPNPQNPRPPSEIENLPNPYFQKVYAPAGGRVLRILEKNERIIQAGAPIIEIGNTNTIEIVVDVLSTEATEIRPGALMLIENQTSAEPVKARVRIVEPQAFTKISALGVEEQRVNVVADFLTKDVRFGDNFRVDTRIIVWQNPDVLKIPSSALFRNGEKWNVFVVEYGRARRREISVGHQTPVETEILQGLNEGETVVLHPPNGIADGTRVETE